MATETLVPAHTVLVSAEMTSTVGSVVYAPPWRIVGCQTCGGAYSPRVVYVSSIPLPPLPKPEVGVVEEAPEKPMLRRRPLEDEPPELLEDEPPELLEDEPP
jgi:hypothetical protein